MPNEELNLDLTAGAEPLHAVSLRVATNAEIIKLDEMVHDPDGLQKLQDLSVLDDIGRSNGITGKELLRVLERSLGLAKVDRQPHLDRLDDLNTRGRGVKEPDEAEYDSDDDLFNGEDDGLHLISSNLNFIENVVGATPQSAEEAAAVVKAGRDETRVILAANKELVPPLPFGRHDEGNESLALVTSADQLAWRRIPKHDIAPAEFFGQFKKRRTLGPDPESSNLVNKPVYLTPVNSKEYEIEKFEFPYEAMHVSDAQKEMERALRTLDKNLRRDAEIAQLVIPTDESLGAQEMTAVDRYLANQHEESKKAAIADEKDFIRMSAAEQRVATIEKAILAAKTSDVAAMEEALDADLEGEGISPDTTTDEQGNTLLILAAQQGSKRMCKLLLRRGANINRQNVITGNTVLHFCCLFSHDDLAKYLISKGADETILNADGLTCYEAPLAEEIEY